MRWGHDDNKEYNRVTSRTLCPRTVGVGRNGFPSESEDPVFLPLYPENRDPDRGHSVCRQGAPPQSDDRKGLLGRSRDYRGRSSFRRRLYRRNFTMTLLSTSFILRVDKKVLSSSFFFLGGVFQEMRVTLIITRWCRKKRAELTTPSNVIYVINFFFFLSRVRE